jgi:hypothetical protein
MMDALTRAKTIAPKGTGHECTQDAIAWALIAIAEELQKINERAELEAERGELAADPLDELIYSQRDMDEAK